MNSRVFIGKLLRPLIIKDYRLRAENKRPDRFYWADYLLFMKLSILVKPDGTMLDFKHDSKGVKV